MHIIYVGEKINFTPFISLDCVKTVEYCMMFNIIQFLIN